MSIRNTRDIELLTQRVAKLEAMVARLLEETPTTEEPREKRKYTRKAPRET